MGQQQQQQQIDEAGRCAFHPGIQLQHLKKSGEWRVLLNACPLCVSGLPATGRPIAPSRPIAPPVVVAASPVGNAASRAEMAAAENRERTRKKKKHSSPQPHDGDEGAANVIRGEGGGSREEDAGGQLQHRAIGGEDFVDKISRGFQKQERSGKDRSCRSGISVQGRRSSATPLSARPRSPSPQSPAVEQKLAAAAEGRGDGEGHTAVVRESATMDPCSGINDTSGITEDFNEFLKFLQIDAIEQQWKHQQKQQSHGDRESLQEYHNQQQQQSISVIDQSNRSKSSAVDTVSYADTASHSTSAEDEAFAEEESPSDKDLIAANSIGVLDSVPVQQHQQQILQQHMQEQMQQQIQQEQMQQQVHQLQPPNAIPQTLTSINQVSITATPLRHHIPSPTKLQPNRLSLQKRSKSPHDNSPSLPPQAMPPKLTVVTIEAVPTRSEVLPKRPDPEDTDEFSRRMDNGINNHAVNVLYQHHYQAHHSPPPPLGPLNHLISRPGGAYPVQQHQQPQLLPLPLPPQKQSYPCDADAPTTKVLEQDEVSMMSMSSVTRNVNKQKQQPRAHNMGKADLDSSVFDSDPFNNPKSLSRSSSRAAASNKSSRSLVSNDPSNNGVSGEINTCVYDNRGRCRRHPTVRLRKKQLMRGWKVVLSNCPECCLDEMRRVKDERRRNRKSRGKGGTQSENKSRSSKAGSSGRSEKKRGKNPPVSQVDGDDFDDSRSVGTASTITISSYTHSTGAGRWQNYTSDSQSVGSGGGGRSVASTGSTCGISNIENKAPAAAAASTITNGNSSPNCNLNSVAKVTRMPYTDTYGEQGWYTSQVDASSGTPNGFGMVNYQNGAVDEGEWRDGVSVTSSKTREEHVLEGGGLGGPPTKHVVGPRHSRKVPHQFHRQHNGTLRSPPVVGRSYLATLNEDGSSSDYDYASRRSPGRPRSSSATPAQQWKHHLQQPQQQRQQNQQRVVVCGMPWTDTQGGFGVYTGEVNWMNVPDGMGSMRYDHGMVVEGLWRDGEMGGSDNDGGDSFGSGGYSRQACAASNH